MRHKLFDRRAFGRRVREASYQISVRKAARQVGISPATFNRVSRGYTPSVEVYLRLLDWLSGAGKED